MFAIFEDGEGAVCVNLDSGLRFRPIVKNGMNAGIWIVFPDGSTNIKVRGDYEKIVAKLGAVDMRAGVAK